MVKLLVKMEENCTTFTKKKTCLFTMCEMICILETFNGILENSYHLDLLVFLYTFHTYIHKHNMHVMEAVGIKPVTEVQHDQRSRNTLL